MVEQHILKVERTARVYTHGRLSEKTEQIWVAAHGYGMLAEYFIRKFEVLDPERFYVIAPEGLSRAYIEGMSGKVGATWMTSEMRLHEIDDYVRYLNAVVSQFIDEDRLLKVGLVAFGFSQGAATVSRWVFHSPLPFRAMILWGGAPAEELFEVDSFNKLSVFLAFGDKDDYITFANKERLRVQIEKKGWSFEFIEYQGGHHLISPLISAIGEKLHVNKQTY